MSKSHIAYGPKDAIGAAVAKKLIPTNCLVITKVDDPTEEAEMLYFDSDYVSHQISARHVFDSVEDATTWVGKYHCVGRHIVAKDNDEWHTYIVGDDNELIVADGSEKVSVVTAGDASIEINGTTISPTLSVKIDPSSANGLSVSDNGLMINLATDASAGAMSAMDKFKLDEIEDGAQVNTITDIGVGRTNGTISVNGVDVAVKGLRSAAFTDSEDYTPAGIAMSHRIVDELPQVGTAGTIYLVPNSGGRPNIYDEFLYVDGNFELIGTTETDLSDYYTKQEAEAMTRAEIDTAIEGKADASTLARVATTGSFNDLTDKPSIATAINVTKRNDGYYYPDITYNEAISILEDGQQLTIHWPEDHLVYQCVIWRSTSSSIFFGAQDNQTYRLLRWNSLTSRVEVYSGATFASSSDLGGKVDKVSGKGLSTNDFTNTEKEKLAGFGSANLYALKSDIGNKVDKVDGKGLSTNDFTTAEKEKLAGFSSADSYALKSDMEQLYKYKGSVASQTALPSSGNEVGDVYNTEDTGMNYAWNGSQWDALGATYHPAQTSDMIIVSETQPSSEYNELWIDPDTESVLVPTMDDIEGTYAKKSEVESTYARKAAVGSPLRAATASAMTDVTKIYVYTGSESGYTSGHWYYYNGSSWADGGVYNSVAFVTDKTLTGDGEAADAKTVGDEVTNLKSALNDSGIFVINESVTFVQGGVRVNDNGDTENTTRIRSSYVGFSDNTPYNSYADCSGDFEFSVLAIENASPYRFVGVLQDDDTFVPQTEGSTIRYVNRFKPTDIQASSYLFRFLMRKKSNPSANITPSESDSFHVYKNKIEFLTKQATEIEQTVNDNVIYDYNVNIGTVVNDKYITATGYLSNYNGWSATQDFIPCDEYDKLIFTTQYSQSRTWNAWYKSASEGDSSFISQFTINPGQTVIEPPADAKYFRISSTTSDMQTVSVKGITTIKSVVSSMADETIISDEYLKVLTWNVGIFNDGTTRVPTSDSPAQIAKLKKLVGIADAHVFNAQEYSQYIDVSNTIASVPIMGFKYPNTVGTYGTISFSKVKTSNKAWKWFDADNTRGFWSYDIQNGNKIISVIVTHLSIEIDASVHRNAEIAELITFMDTKDYVILTGDFNVYSDTEFDAFKTAGYTLCNGGDFGWFKTWPVNIDGSAWGSENLDNIIVSSNIIPQYVNVLESTMSDHAPLYAELWIK